ncbi:MAG: group 1 glycosyl transferase [Methylotenera sp.]|nr:MAG: group 1 glycosyl transferase [Proteobacteria bacterium ST_bin12]PPD56912.1 MAG: group 1 glycosyl transferase [Methylotenera sp.]
MTDSQPTCIVVTCFSENQPGFLDFSYRLQALAKHYQLTILSQDMLSQTELMIEGANYIALGRKSGKLGWLSYLYKCANTIRKQQPSLAVLLHSSASPISLMVGKIPTCLYWNEHPTNLMHVVKAFSPVRNTLAKMAHWLVFYGAKRADLIMPIGEDHQEDLIHHGVKAEKIKMIYMGVADSFVPQHVNKEVPQHDNTQVQQHTQTEAPQNKPIHLIYIGTVSQARGRDVMLDAMAVLAKETALLKRNGAIKLTIVGATESELTFCQQRVKALKIEQFVQIVGRVSGHEIPAYLAQADVGICLWEQNQWNEFNPPTKLFEYLVAGIPVLASNIRTHTRYINDWQNGLIFDYDAQSLAHTIFQLHTNKHELLKFKHHAVMSGRQHVWSKIEPVFLDAIQKLSASKQQNFSMIQP